MKNNDAFVWRKKKIIGKNMGLNGWCLFCLNLSCISPLLCLLKEKKKKDIVHDVFSGHNDVHLWNVYQIKKKNKTKREKKKKNP